MLTTLGWQSLRLLSLLALAAMAQWIEHWPVNQKIMAPSNMKKPRLAEVQPFTWDLTASNQRAWHSNIVYVFLEQNPYSSPLCYTAVPRAHPHSNSCCGYRGLWSRVLQLTCWIFNQKPCNHSTSILLETGEGGLICLPSSPLPHIFSGTSISKCDPILLFYFYFFIYFLLNAKGLAT